MKLFVAPIKRPFNVSTMVPACAALCLDAAPSSLCVAARVCSSAIAVFSAVMSCLMTAESSAISLDGSSNAPVRFASCASRSSFSLVPWIPCPTRDAIFANSLFAPVRDLAPSTIGSRTCEEFAECIPSSGADVEGSYPSAPVDPPSRGVVDPAPPGPPGPPAAASVFAARSHAAANSFVRSFTPMPTPIET